MKITDLEVDGFGVWSGFEVTELGDELTVFYGPNEAGKTTLMQFVRSVFYGFSAERRGRYLPPLGGGRPGGSLQVSHNQRRLTLSRHGDSLDPLGRSGVRDAAGTQLGGHVLADLLGDVDETAFNHVFAFGLREIQELGTLGDSEAAHLLYDLTLGLDRVSLIDVLRELDASRKKLLSQGEQPSLIVQLWKQQERLQSEIAELQAAAPRYIEMVAQRRQIIQEITQAEAQRDDMDRQLVVLELARGLRDKWRERQSLDQRLVELGPIGEPVDEVIAQVDKLNIRLNQRHERRAALKKKGRKLRHDARKLSVNETLCRATSRLEALAEQQPWISSLATQISHCEVDILELEAQQEVDRNRWGFTPMQGKAGNRNEARRAPDTLLAAAKTLSMARHQYVESRKESAEDRNSTTAISSQLKAALGSRADQGVVKAMERAGELVAQLRRRVQLDERLEQMERNVQEAQTQREYWLDRQLLPPWALAGLGALFVLGAAFLIGGIVGLLFSSSVVGNSGWPLCFFGLICTAIGGMTKVVLEREASQHLDSSQKQMNLLTQQIKKAHDERDALDQTLPRGGGSMIVRLQTAERELATLEDLLPLESQRDVTSREAQARTERQRKAESEWKKAQHNWRQALLQAGLPENMRPKQLREYFQSNEQVRESARRLEQRRTELAEQRREHATVSARISQLAAEVGLATTATDPLGQLRHLLTELREQDSRLKRREAILREFEAVRKLYKRTGSMFNKLRTRRFNLLRDAGVKSEKQLRHLAEMREEALLVQEERDNVARDIAASVLPYTEEMLATYLDGDKNVDALTADIQRSLPVVRGRLERLFEQRGEINQQLKALAEDRQLAYKQIELGMVDKRLQDALARWRVLAVAGLVLEAVRELYERDRQPEALREATTYFEQLTSGRYTRVWTPWGEHALRVDDATGKSLSVEVLSHGTREQLFLSLRLALVNTYARRGVQLPLVLDDVFVNFDGMRTKAAAQVLQAFSKLGHQLLVFTCHEHIARLFTSLHADVRKLPDRFHRDEEPEVVEPEPAPKQVVPEPKLVAPEPLVVPPAPRAVVVEFENRPIVVPSVHPASGIPASHLPKLPEIRPLSIAPQTAPPIERRPTPVATDRRVRGQRKLRRRTDRAVERRVAEINWSAEEFSGELADRVHRSQPLVDVISEYEEWVAPELEPLPGGLVEGSDEVDAA